MRRVAMVGAGEGCDLCPREGWEIWGMPWHIVPYADRYYEIHENLEETYLTQDWRERLSALGVPIFMPERRVPNAVLFPMQRVMGAVGRKYLTSTIAFMLAHALVDEGIAEVGLYGINGDDGYAEQRPCVEYLCGRLEGNGITVTVPDCSKLFTGGIYGGSYGNLTV